MAALPIIASAVSAVVPYIPTIVQMVEGLFGHSSNTGQKTGDQKLQTAVDLGKQLLAGLANSGAIPSAGVTDPNLPSALVGAIQQVVDNLKAQGALNGAASTAITGLALPVTFTGQIQIGQK